MVHIAPTFFPPASPTESFRIQLELAEIDGTLSALSKYRGFRNFFVAKCNEIKLDGYIWRVPKTRAKILACGSKDKIEQLLEFCAASRAHRYIRAYFEE